jgi:fructose-specific phosphotransferase system IIC component
VTEFTRQALEPFRAQGLHSAMFIIPVLGGLLMLVLFAGSRTVAKDMEKLRRWMHQSTTEAPVVEAVVKAAN